jgi:hypothetical protein
MIPRFAKLPLRRPQVKANRRGLSFRYCLLLLVPTLSNNLKALSCSTYTPWWFVLRLSICLWYKLDQKSVQINFIMSSSSLNLLHSLVRRSMILYPTLNPIHSKRESSSSQYYITSTKFYLSVCAVWSSGSSCREFSAFGASFRVTILYHISSFLSFREWYRINLQKLFH